MYPDDASDKKIQKQRNMLGVNVRKHCFIYSFIPEEQREIEIVEMKSIA